MSLNIGFKFHFISQPKELFVCDDDGNVIESPDDKYDNFTHLVCFATFISE